MVLIKFEILEMQHIKDFNRDLPFCDQSRKWKERIAPRCVVFATLVLATAIFCDFVGYFESVIYGNSFVVFRM